MGSFTETLNDPRILPLGIPIKIAIERLRFTFTPNGRREFVPCDQVFPLFRLLFIASTQKYVV